MENLKEQFEELEELVATARGELDKFVDKGNKSAGTRARTTLQNVKKLAQQIRLDIQAAKNA